MPKKKERKRRKIWIATRRSSRYVCRGIGVRGKHEVMGGKEKDRTWMGGKEELAARSKSKILWVEVESFVGGESTTLLSSSCKTKNPANIAKNIESLWFSFVEREINTKVIQKRRKNIFVKEEKRTKTQLSVDVFHRPIISPYSTPFSPSSLISQLLSKVSSPLRSSICTVDCYVVWY